MLRWVLGIAFTLVMLVVIAAGVLLLVPAERIADLAEDRFEAATGRNLQIDGAVRATLWPRLGVRAEDITVANAPWSDRGPMLRADALEIGVTAATIFGGTVEVELLQLEGAALLLERRADGSGNWEMTPASTAAATSAPATDAAPSAAAQTAVAIARAVLTGADVTFIDEGLDQTWRVQAVDLVTGVPDMAGPVSARFSALVNGVALTGEARVAALQGFIDGALTPVTAALTAGATSVAFDGRADLDPLSLDGRLDVTSDDRLAALQAVGLPALDLPEGFGARALAISAAATLAPEGSLHLRDMTVTADGNTLSGALDLLPGDARPRITATLAAPALDLTGISREGQGGETALVSDTGWGRDVIDVSGLFAADADVTFASGPVTLGDASLDQVALAATVDNGRAVVTLQPVVAYGGTVTGDVVINGRGGLSARANLDLKGLQMQPFLTEFADYDRLVGQADLTLRLLGVGDTSQALVESLGGSLAFNIGQGEILGLDVGGMIRNLDMNFRGEGQKTVFDGIAASFAIENGIARGDDLALEAPLLVSSGAGTIDLGAQTLDYRLLPTLRRNAESGGITVPVLITGPWSNPRIRPDLEYLARQRLEAEREELEARARAEAAELEARARAEAEEARARAEEQARTRVAEELNVTPDALTDGEALQDAIKDRVEEQLLDLLLNR